MMGRLSHDQEQFFYSFRPDEAVPEDHAVREIAAVLDLSWAYSELAPDAHRRLRVRHSLGAVALPGGSGQLGVPLVLRFEHRGQDPGSFGVLAGPQRTLP